MNSAKKTLLTLLALVPMLAACNTMEGMGEDIQKGGQKLEQKAEQNK